MEVSTYVAGNFRVGMAPIVMMKLPNTYTRDSKRMVLNFPSQLSDMIAPKILMNEAIETNVWKATVAVSLSNFNFCVKYRTKTADVDRIEIINQ